MTFKQFLLTMLMATLIVWLAWGFILLNIDPMVSGWSGLVFFFGTLLVALIGTIAIFGTVARRVLKPRDLVSRQVLSSFRQAVWLSLILVITLILLSQSVFRLWIISLVIAVFAMVELAFLSARRRPMGLVDE
jgi:hypothetical protein